MDASADPERSALSDLLALVVHDLRNPVATVSANASFLREVGVLSDRDATEALDDVQLATRELMQGLEQLSWIGRWMGGKTSIGAVPGDLVDAVRAACREVSTDVAYRLHGETADVVGGATVVPRLFAVLLRNALIHANPETISIDARREASRIVVEVRDGGRAVAEDLRGAVFTLEGQAKLKGRTDGRVSRAAGLLAARSLADAAQAQLEAGGADGAAFFRVTLRVAGVADGGR